MYEKYKNIINLSKLYIKENDASLRIINVKEKTIDKKSFLFWMYVVLFFGIIYLSNEIINYTIKIGKPEIFLNGFLLCMAVLIIIKTIMVSMNVFYFSKEIENILYLPIKPIEILISKFNTILFMNYEFLFIFALVPLFNYGILNFMKSSYILNLMIILIVFPIFATLAISIIMIILMKTIKLFKNKDIMQIIISFGLIFALMSFFGKAIQYVFNNAEYIEQNQEIVLNNINDKIIRINTYFVSVNQTANILQNKEIIFNYLKIILMNGGAFLLFILVGNKLYLKQLLKANFYFKPKNKIIKVNKKIKKNKIGISYLKKEFKMILKNPAFFIQCIYPIIITTIIVSILVIAIVPAYRQIIQGEEYEEIRNNLVFNMEAVCLILSAIQIIGLFNYTSITAFSREGQNAYIMKLIPVGLFKQFIYKAIPQIIINVISGFVILLVINFRIPEIGFKYILVMFGLSVLLTIINSFILCLIDLIMPRLKWDSEYEILKHSRNKLLQYVLIIFNIIFFIFIDNLFEKHRLDISLGVFTGMLTFILVIMNIMINKFKNKLYKKITY